MAPLWRFIDSGERDGAWNMEADTRSAMDLLQGTGTETLRLYGWSPWAISVGYHQDMGEINQSNCAADGIDVVRRPTGGRAIFHAQEITYCVVLEGSGRGILEIYNYIGNALLAGLRLYGIDCQLERSQPHFPDLYRKASSIPCFSSSARYEICSGGKKLVGSAQRRFRENRRDVVLQHGSILCGPAHERLADYIESSTTGSGNQIREDLRNSTTQIGGITGQPVDRGRLVGCLREGFMSAWAIEFEDVLEQGMPHE